LLARNGEMALLALLTIFDGGSHDIAAITFPRAGEWVPAMLSALGVILVVLVLHQAGSAMRSRS
jgi:hypothetical protein